MKTSELLKLSLIERKQLWQQLTTAEKVELRLQLRREIQESSVVSRRLLRILAEITRDMYNVDSFQQFSSASKFRATELTSKLSPSSFVTQVQRILNSELLD